MGRGRLGHFVFAVAIHAKRDVGVPFQRFTTVDAAGVFLENEAMAFAAGRRIFGGEMGNAPPLNIVNSMTVRADRGEIEQALVVESAAVDTLAVFLVGGFGMDVVFHNNIHVRVATGAREGDVAAIDHGLRVGDGLDIVPSMTVPATGHFRDLAFEVGPAVDAVGIGSRRAAGSRFRGLLMAGSRARRGRNIFLGLVG